MHSFKDTKGRQWSIEFNVATAKRVKAMTGFSVMGDHKPGVMVQNGRGDGAFIWALMGDVILLVDVLFAVLKPQADEANVSDEDFAEGLGGDTLEAATDALLKAMIDFFPNPRERQNLQLAYQQMNQWLERGGKKIEKTLSDGSFLARAEAMMDKALASLDQDLGLKLDPSSDAKTKRRGKSKSKDQGAEGEAGGTSSGNAAASSADSTPAPSASGS